MTGMIRIANKKDFHALQQFLTKAGANQLNENIKQTVFLIKEDINQSIQATVGLTVLEESALLQSFVLSKEIQTSEIVLLFQAIDQVSEKMQVEQLFVPVSNEQHTKLFEWLGFVQWETGLPEKVLDAQKKKTKNEYHFFMGKKLGN